MTTKLNKKVADKKIKEKLKWLGDAKYVYEYGCDVIIEYVRKDEGTTAFTVKNNIYNTITEAILHCELGDDYGAVDVICKMFKKPLDLSRFV